MANQLCHQAPDECFPLVSRPAQAVDLAAMPHHGGPHAAVAGGSQGGLALPAAQGQARKYGGAGHHHGARHGCHAGHPGAGPASLGGPPAQSGGVDAPVHQHFDTLF
eukprot:CAMPEP_0202347976 /NCGR_PEP_ID=MMETSP1126-20121109/6107_1 /ASSEMBLY_ACC=CAM_ASM_000457 /TAXON_ID=3047 /ORGANISM="Dunaliella tertiolecta, Strain CCMP1320" /LENGTH=106 /DNA_ID=CAMNT_0048939603 /DNA_START=900 /DNA_END=1220 /DNA_ORIENTATION=-